MHISYSSSEQHPTTFPVEGTAACDQVSNFLSRPAHQPRDACSVSLDKQWQNKSLLKVARGFLQHAFILVMTAPACILARTCLLWLKHVPRSLSQCIWLAFSITSLTLGKPKCAVSFASSLNQTMEDINSSRTKRFSLKQTIMHIAAAIQAAVKGQGLPCIYLAHHEPESRYRYCYW